MKVYSALAFTAVLVANVSAGCWSEKLGYKCCEKTIEVRAIDKDGKWGVENNEWCGITSNEKSASCWSTAYGYPCCKTATEIVSSTDEGKWGIENGQWCGIQKSNFSFADFFSNFFSGFTFNNNNNLNINTNRNQNAVSVTNPIANPVGQNPAPVNSPITNNPITNPAPVNVPVNNNPIVNPPPANAPITNNPVANPAPAPVAEPVAEPVANPAPVNNNPAPAPVAEPVANPAPVNNNPIQEPVTEPVVNPAPVNNNPVPVSAPTSTPVNNTPSTAPATQRPNKLPAVDQTIAVKKENASTFNNGKFEGFGTSFCWWANRLGYSDVLADKAATAFYDKKDGLGLTIIRYNIGGGDDPTHNHITRTDSDIPGYAINNSYDPATKTYHWDYNWNSDANQRNVLFKAIQKNSGEIIAEAFSNSPPYFMTNSGCSSGARNSNEDNLKSDAYPAFAKYLADVIEHFKTEWRVSFQSVSAMNEPYTNYWGANSNKQEGSHFDQGRSQSQIIVELQKALAERGLTGVQVTATDETSIDTQIDSFNKLSNEAKNIVTRIDTHSYGGSKRGELRNLAERSRKNLWMSEVDGGGTEGTNAGEMGAGLWLANRIITDLNGLRPSAWVLWQAIDNHISRNGVNGKKDSGMVNLNNGYWGVAVANHDSNQIILTQKYYAFGQFSRYIRPGYTIISCTDNAVAAYDEVGKKLVIVATNKSSGNKTVDFDLSGFSKVGYNVSVIRTSGDSNTGEKWAELKPIVPYGNGFNAELKANSVTTFIVSDVEK